MEANNKDQSRNKCNREKKNNRKKSTKLQGGSLKINKIDKSIARLTKKKRKDSTELKYEKRQHYN